MGLLSYSAMCSLDGYIADAGGGFDWAVPDDEVHAFVNDLERPVGTYLYGRRMYDVMRTWETISDDCAIHADFGRIWRAADKVVYSRTLDAVSTGRTRLERTFDPAEVIAMKATSPRDLSVGGAGLAAAAFAAGLVDECHLFVAPVIVGGGTRALPDGIRAGLELRDERRFDGGFVHLHYGVRASSDTFNCTSRPGQVDVSDAG
jgi:dihydrofolate reductase